MKKINIKEMSSAKKFLTLTIDEKDFWQLKSIKKYFTNLAKVVTNRYGDSHLPALKVNFIWDTREEADVAYTNGNIVTINVASNLLEGFTRAQKFTLIIGLLGHECGHVVYTNFKVYKEFFQKRNFEEFDFARCSKEFNEWALEYVDLLLKIMKETTNILEDPYIEYRMIETFEGSLKNGIKSMENILQNFQQDQYEKCQKSGEAPFFLMLLLMQARNCLPEEYASMEEWQATQKIFDRLYIKPFPNQKERVNMSLKILDILFEKYIKDDFSPDKEDAEATKRANDKVSESSENSGSSKAPDLDSEGTENSDEEVSDGTEEDETQTEDNSEENTDPKEYEGESSDIGEEDNTTDVISFDDFEKALDEIFDKNGKEFLDEIDDFAAREEILKAAGQCHEGYTHRIKKVYPVDSIYEKEFEAIKTPAKIAANKIRDKVFQKKKSLKNNRQLKGPKIDIKAYAQRKNESDLAVFSNRTKPNKLPNMCVSMIVDCSGSMYEKDRIVAARKSAFLVESFCSQLEIPCSCIGQTTNGFGNSPGCDHEQVLLLNCFDFEHTKKESKNISGLTALCNNRDGYAYKYALYKIKKRKEPFKVIIIISDGEPAAQGYGGFVGTADIQGFLKEAKKNNVSVLSFNIGTDQKALKKIYGDIVDCSNLQDAPKNIALALEKESKKYL